MKSLLQTVGWLACIVYSTIPCFWFLIHPRAKYWRSCKRSPYFILLPVWFAMWLAMGLITAPWRRAVLYANPITWIPAVLLFAAGLWIYLESGEQFSSAKLGGAPEIRADYGEQNLITSGIHGKVRHPVYLGHLIEMLAWSIGTGLIVLYALTAFAILTGAFMIRMEDAELEERFGEEFRQYRSQVPAVLPRLF